MKCSSRRAEKRVFFFKGKCGVGEALRGTKSGRDQYAVKRVLGAKSSQVIEEVANINLPIMSQSPIAECYSEYIG
jgi:hypothetical protein